MSSKRSAAAVGHSWSRTCHSLTSGAATSPRDIGRSGAKPLTIRTSASGSGSTLTMTMIPSRNTVRMPSACTESAPTSAGRRVQRPARGRLRPRRVGQGGLSLGRSPATAAASSGRGTRHSRFLGLGRRGAAGVGGGAGRGFGVDVAVVVVVHGLALRIEDGQGSDVGGDAPLVVLGGVEKLGVEIVGVEGVGDGVAARVGVHVGDLDPLGRAVAAALDEVAAGAARLGVGRVGGRGPAQTGAWWRRGAAPGCRGGPGRAGRGGRRLRRCRRRRW